MARRKTQIELNVTTNEIKGEKEMKNQRPEINVTVARNAKVEDIINALATIDRENNYSTHYSNELVETIMYDKYVQGNEVPDTIYSFTFTETKTVRTLALIVPFVLGYNYFSIEYDRVAKQGTLNFRVKTPYGNYRESLEQRGLVFTAYQDKENQKVRDAEQQDAIAEANSILAAAGLKFYSL